jgi:hypothetical protein
VITRSKGRFAQSILQKYEARAGMGSPLTPHCAKGFNPKVPTMDLTRINIALTIPPNQFEEPRNLGAILIPIREFSL